MHASTDALARNASTNPESYTLNELEQEIAKREDWRTAFRYVPKASKAKLKFHQTPHISTKISWLPQRLLIGGLPNPGSTNELIYAEVSRSPSGSFNLVDIRYCNGTTKGLHSSPKVEDTKMLQSVVYVEPFSCIEGVGSTGWRKRLRFLVLYYFLAVGMLKELVCISDGLVALRRTCMDIASKSRQRAKKPARPRLETGKKPFIQETDPEKMESRLPECAKQNDVKNPPNIKHEPLPAFASVQAPENDSTRVVSSMVLNNDKIASLLLPKLRERH